jgi:hypothetical protein
MGRRTSVYLDDALEAAVRASGVPVAELVRRGLDMAPGTVVAGVRVVADERVPAGTAALVNGTGRVAVAGIGAPDGMAEVPAAVRPGRCPPHPPGRVHKGLCGACGTGGL